MTNTYKLNEKYRGRFLKLPKELFELERYRSLSSESKLLYALLLERTGLSQRNGIVNSYNELYVVMTRKEVSDFFGVTENTAKELFNSLERAGLIIDERKGRGFANRIYVLKPELSTLKNTVQESQNERVQEPQNGAVHYPQNGRVQEPQNLRPIDNNINNTDLNETDKNNIGHTTSNNTRVLTDIEIMEKILARCDQSKLTPYVKINVRGAIGYALKCEGMTVDGVFLEKDEVMKLVNKINTECLNRMSDLLLTLNWHRSMTTEQRSEVLMKAIMEVSARS